MYVGAVIWGMVALSVPLSVVSSIEWPRRSFLGVVVGDGATHYPSGGSVGPVRSVSTRDRSVGIVGVGGGSGGRHFSLSDFPRFADGPHLVIRDPIGCPPDTPGGGRWVGSPGG